MTNALVVNCSAPHYNLGASKMADWLDGDGYPVTRWQGDPGMFADGYDLVALSVIFSWHAPVARRIALQVRGHADVWAGGPGLFALGNWWTRETGLGVQQGLDHRFERQRGAYRMTFASRGCPVGCWFCIVPKIEGAAFTLDPDFVPAPILCDNNLSALPVDYQEHIISRYVESGTRLLDANSGFEPATFDEATYERWRHVLRGPWRLALDESREIADVERALDILAGVRRAKKRIYVLIGNEPMAACYERATKVVELGAEPFCQPVVSLNSLDGRPRVRYDWTEGRLKDFARYFNRFLWKYTPIAEYSNRQGERPPFAGVL